MKELDALRHWLQKPGKENAESRMVLFIGTAVDNRATVEALAKQSGKPLMAVALSQRVSRYIGETEKNLDTAFRKAEAANALLFFDEADALFGKRTTVSDSNDRYANTSVTQLLQRMEAYAGVCILSVQQKANLDEAFMRRFRFVIQFPAA